jgi:hypothetical protein
MIVKVSIVVTVRDCLEHSADVYFDTVSGVNGTNEIREGSRKNVIDKNAKRLRELEL